MRLDELLDTGDPALGSVAVTGLAYDSRRVSPGNVFFCVSGFERDGHDFAAAAVARGAVALVVEHPVGLGVPELIVPSARAAMAPAAARLQGDPSQRLRVVGITGTNGKTTSAFLVRALLEAGGEQCALLGTVKAVIGGVEHPVARTTAEAIDLQAALRAMLDAGDRACVMEVSSHASELARTDSIRFAVAIFTNLTQDHLDFHAGMEEYFQAKRRLFTAAGGPAPGVSVINVDDGYGRRLAAEVPGALTFAIDDQRADYHARDLRLELAGSRLTLVTPEGTRELALPLPGRFNVANSLGALAGVHALGGDLDVLVAALARGVRVPGRLEAVDEGQDFAVLVDYAHTPDSLENVLSTARQFAAGRVWCVFGAGGDRDRGKRPLMGEIAATLADAVLVTSDNPRSEEPQAIIDQIMAGAARARRPPGAEPVQALVDRRAAIAAALGRAGGGDVVLVAGKGHEQGQELADGQVVPFDDVAVAREVLRSRTSRP